MKNIRDDIEFNLNEFLRYKLYFCVLKSVTAFIPMYLSSELMPIKTIHASFKQNLENGKI